MGVLALLFAAIIAGPSQPVAIYIDVRTDEVRKYTVPWSAVVESIEGQRSEAGWRFDVVFEGSANPASREPQVLEIHLFGDQGTVGVYVLVLQGGVELKPTGQLTRGEAVFLRRSGEVVPVPTEIREDGFTIQMPPTEDVVSWQAITLWRPETLPERFSPSSLWDSVISAYDSEEPLMWATPSLMSFLQYEFGKP